MKRKGQAAMEFLMTYGWAILAAVIVIGVLAIYFRPSTVVDSGFNVEYELCERNGLVLEERPLSTSTCNLINGDFIVKYPINEFNGTYYIEVTP